MPYGPVRTLGLLSLRLCSTHSCYIHCDMFSSVLRSRASKGEDDGLLIPPKYPDSLRKASHPLAFVLYILVYLTSAWLTTFVLAGISWLLIRSETWASVTTVTAPARKVPRPPRPKRRKSRPRGVQDAAYCWSEDSGNLVAITSVASEEPSSRYHCEYSLHSSCCVPSTSKPMHPSPANACHARPAASPPEGLH
jgi:hypothetical protein